MAACPPGLSEVLPGDSPSPGSGLRCHGNASVGEHGAPWTPPQSAASLAASWFLSLQVKRTERQVCADSMAVGRRASRECPLLLYGDGNGGRVLPRLLPRPRPEQCQMQVHVSSLRSQAAESPRSPPHRPRQDRWALAVTVGAWPSARPGFSFKPGHRGLLLVWREKVDFLPTPPPSQDDTNEKEQSAGCSPDRACKAGTHGRGACKGLLTVGWGGNPEERGIAYEAAASSPRTRHHPGDQPSPSTAQYELAPGTQANMVSVGSPSSNL